MGDLVSGTPSYYSVNVSSYSKVRARGKVRRVIAIVGMFRAERNPPRPFHVRSGLRSLVCNMAHELKAPGQEVPSAYAGQTIRNALFVRGQAAITTKRTAWHARSLVDPNGWMTRN